MRAAASAWLAISTERMEIKSSRSWVGVAYTMAGIWLTGSVQLALRERRRSRVRSNLRAICLHFWRSGSRSTVASDHRYDHMRAKHAERCGISTVCLFLPDVHEDAIADHLIHAEYTHGFEHVRNLHVIFLFISRNYMEHFVLKTL